MLKKDAVKHYGSQYYLAKALNINLSAVTRWGKWVPLKRAFRLAELTDGKLKVALENYLERGK
jgi:transcriptional repressor of cell division inhibition gene dicB